MLPMFRLHTLAGFILILGFQGNIQCPLILLVISMATETLDEKKSEEEELKDKGNEEGSKAVR
ncbi:hypothetical protein V6Z11_D02G093200 [Gossypium hirsutum]